MQEDSLPPESITEDELNSLIKRVYEEDRPPEVITIPTGPLVGMLKKGGARCVPAP